MVADIKATMLKSAVRSTGAEGRVASSHTTTEFFEKTPNPKTGTWQQRFRFSAFRLIACKPRLYGALKRSRLISHSACAGVRPSTRSVCGDGDRGELVPSTSPQPGPNQHTKRERIMLYEGRTWLREKKLMGFVLNP